MTTQTQQTAAPTTDGARNLTQLLEPDDVVVTLTTRHPFGLQQVKASVRLVSGLVRTDQAGGLVGLEAELDAASFRSGSRFRDRAVASPRLLDARQHPYLVFRSTSTSTTADGGWEVRGTLTAKGVTAPTTLVVRPPTSDAGTVRAAARIDRYAHGITAGRGLASRYLDLEIAVAIQALGQP